MYDQSTEMLNLEIDEQVESSSLDKWLHAQLSDFLKKVKSDPSKMYGLAIAGSCLPTVYSDAELSVLIKKVFESCKSVIIYRSSPAQKAETVAFIKRGNRCGRGVVTMAIGDGANDVNMIQTAHIGIGIQGKEGTQAALFADYAVP